MICPFCNKNLVRPLTETKWACHDSDHSTCYYTDHFYILRDHNTLTMISGHTKLIEEEYIQTEIYTYTLNGNLNKTIYSDNQLHSLEEAHTLLKRMTKLQPFL